jgi:hypothetical protein
MKIPFLNGLCKENYLHSQGKWEVDLTVQELQNEIDALKQGVVLD